MNGWTPVRSINPKDPENAVAMQLVTKCADPLSKPSNEVLPYCPHSCPFSVNEHWNTEEHTYELNAPENEENLLATRRFQPVRKEQREDKTMEYVWTWLAMAQSGGNWEPTLGKVEGY